MTYLQTTDVEEKPSENYVDQRKDLILEFLGLKKLSARQERIVGDRCRKENYILFSNENGIMVVCTGKNESHKEAETR